MEGLAQLINTLLAASAYVMLSKQQRAGKFHVPYESWEVREGRGEAGLVVKWEGDASGIQNTSLEFQHRLG